MAKVANPFYAEAKTAERLGFRLDLTRTEDVVTVELTPLNDKARHHMTQAAMGEGQVATGIGARCKIPRNTSWQDQLLIVKATIDKALERAREVLA